MPRLSEKKAKSIERARLVREAKRLASTVSHDSSEESHDISEFVSLNTSETSRSIANRERESVASSESVPGIRSPPPKRRRPDSGLEFHGELRDHSGGEDVLAIEPGETTVPGQTPPTMPSQEAQVDLNAAKEAYTSEDVLGPLVYSRTTQVMICSECKLVVLNPV